VKDKSVGDGFAGWVTVICRIMSMRFNGQIVRVDDVVGGDVDDSYWWRVQGWTSFVGVVEEVDNALGSWEECGASGSLARVGLVGELDNLLPRISFACLSPFRCDGGGSPSGRGHDRGSWDWLVFHWRVEGDVSMQGDDLSREGEWWYVGLAFSRSSSSMMIDGGRGRWLLVVGLFVVVGGFDVLVELHGEHIFLFLR
jgi:hypothetical protein